MNNVPDPEKPKKGVWPYAPGTGVAPGLAIGTALGAAFNDIGIGVAVGVALGAAFDSLSYVRKKDKAT